MQNRSSFLVSCSSFSIVLNLVLHLFLVQTSFAVVEDTKKAFLKFHQNLFQSCQEEKIECQAFPSKAPEHLKADQAVLLQQMVKPASDDSVALKASLKAVQEKVLKKVPEIDRAYQVLGQEYVQEMPKNHEQAIQWIIKNSQQLSQDLEKVKNYNENQAYTFAKISVLMRFVYEAFHSGNVKQIDLDAKFEFEKAGYAISSKMNRSGPIRP